ncbi:hypothetical protein niasHT_015409 [Heterodera trifolii]|uniref:glucuronosyltransferase n=1 Tax=Heterodera trifolii TaxID=157864 RepID=A0ABD2KZT7_9BILA
MFSSGGVSIALFWLLSFPFSADGLSFLFFLIGTNQFERHTFEFMAQEFARRAHKVMTVKPILVPEEPRLVKPILHMVNEKVLKDVLPRFLSEPLARAAQNVPWGEEKKAENALRVPYWAAHNHSCGKMLNSNLMEVMARGDFDLAILYAGNPCLMGLVHSVGIPFVLFDLEGITDETLVASGAPWNLPELELDGNAFSIFRAFSRRMSRSLSLLSESFAQSAVPWLAQLFSKRFRHLDGPIDALFSSDFEINRKFRDKFPKVAELRRMARLFLVNSDPFLEGPSSATPNNLLPVGGVHIDSIRPLFSPWNFSMEANPKGVIICSFGTQMDTGTMPTEFVRSLLDTFALLSDYRIFWRISPKLSLPGLSPSQFDELSERMPHLNITSFFPQNELLAHHRTRLLITNGGAHSLMEAIHWGVPLLGIPLYGSNRRNLEKVEQRGIGILLEKGEAANAHSLLRAIRRVLNCPKIGRRARELGRSVRLRPSSAFDRSLHALETVARLRPSDGAVLRSSLRSHPLALLFFQSLPFDMSVMLFLCLMALAALVIKSVFKLAALCYRIAAFCAVAAAVPFQSLKKAPGAILNRSIWRRNKLNEGGEAKKEQ